MQDKTNHKRTSRPERVVLEGLDASGNVNMLAKSGLREFNDDGADDDYGRSGEGLTSNTNARGNAGATVQLLADGAHAMVDTQTVYRNLWLFIWLKTIGSFDSGAFSAALGAKGGIGNSWSLNMKEQGILTSSVFLGNVIGCPLAGHLFSRHDERQVLSVALVIHTVFTLFFAAMPFYSIALVNRFFIGITLSFIVVYTPVWVDEFAPKNRQSVWMASHNAGVPLGVMLGYILAVGPQMVIPQMGWNWAFLIKCVLMVPTIAYVMRVDHRTINTTKTPLTGTETKENSGDGAAEDGRRGMAGEDNRIPVTPVGITTTFSGSAYAALFISGATATFSENVNRVLRTPVGELPALAVIRVRHVVRAFSATMAPLLGNVVYLCSVTSLTSLYFVATGLQNFVTQYLQQPPFSASMSTIMIGFGSAVVTAPVCGVIAGGILLDRIGGYKGNLRRVTLFLLAWGSFAVIFSVMCIFTTTTKGFLLVMSVVLFCGGALIPPGAGLTMASLPDNLRSTGAAFSQTMYNLFGNFSGPLVCGWVADATGNLRYGIITLLLSSIFGVVPLLGILYVAFTGAPLANGVGTADVEAGSRNGKSGSAQEVVVMVEQEEKVEMNGRVSVDPIYGSSVAGVVDDSNRCRSESAVSPAQPSPPGPVPQESRSVASVSGRHRSRFAEHDFSDDSSEPAVAVRPQRTEGTPSLRPLRRSPHAVRLSPSPPPPATAATPTGVAFRLTTPSTVSSLPLPATPSPLTGVVRDWAGKSGPLHGPGTVHAKRGFSLTTPVSVQPPAAAATAAGCRATDAELMKLQAEAETILSVPSEEAYGMELVQSWLKTQPMDDTPAPTRSGIRRHH